MNEKTKELEQLAEPLKRWLELHYHVHTNIIIGFDSVKVVWLNDTANLEYRSTLKKNLIE